MCGLYQPSHVNPLEQVDEILREGLSSLSAALTCRHEFILILFDPASPVSSVQRFSFPSKIDVPILAHVNGVLLVALLNSR